jgi:hypothetical protein
LLFVVGAFRSPQRRSVGVIGALSSIAVPVYWILVIHPHLLDSKQAHRAQLAAADAITRQQIVADIDALIASLGRDLQSERELVQLMGKPMPNVHDKFTPVSIEYYPARGGGYELVYWTFWGNADYYVYESKAPQNGWVPKYD